ncbi:ATPase, T2SS/T4P/T4SS family [Marinilactibacillus psychrotolerans]|uniref:ATPase, T2SS/T4P/T4SS family n=1 Tax=Marinilactibacillus psychrotolerans TaxID=191770 RepID=UPI003806FF15
MDDNSAYRDLFFEETDSNLEILNEEVLRLEQNPEDTEIIDSIFRSAHTLKGMAATMGYNTMAKLTHSVENVFELFKSKKAKVDTETVSLVFDCLATLTDIVEALRADESDELDIANLVSRLENVANQKNTEAASVETTTETKSKEIDLVLSNLEESDFTVINQAEQTDYQAYVITVKVDSDSFMKAARAFLVMNKLEQEGDIIYTEPSADKIEEGDFEDYFKMILLSKLDQSDIKNNILETSEIDEVQIAIFDKTQSLRSAKKDVNIVTIEDPVEYQLEGINQVQVNSAIGLTFAKGLRSILRQDPNIIMVGEIRDRETADISIRASLTGHLVFSTLHTNSAIEAIPRLFDMGIEPYLVVSSLSGIMAQRLVKKVCKDCQYTRPVTEIEKEIFQKRGKEIDELTLGKGCNRCRFTGYRGRMAIHELIVIDDQVKEMMMNHSSIQNIKKHIRNKNVPFLIDDGLDKVKEGLTTIEEVLRVATTD